MKLPRLPDYHKTGHPRVDTTKVILLVAVLVFFVLTVISWVPSLGGPVIVPGFGK